jgi:hypothetical protein
MKLTMSEARQMAQSTGELLDRLTRRKMAEDNRLQYHEALKLVASEHPELDRNRTTAMRRLSHNDD